MNTYRVPSLNTSTAAEVLNRWIGDCDRHGVPGDYEIRRANHGELVNFRMQGDFKARWVCVPEGSQFQARTGYPTLKAVLHAKGVSGY